MLIKRNFCFKTKSGRVNQMLQGILVHQGKSLIKLDQG